MKKSYGKNNKRRPNQPQRQAAARPPEPPRPQEPHAPEHPHPRTFKSGATCHFKQQGDHFHAEVVEDTGNIDHALPHVLTAQEQNTLVWLVHRNRPKFKKIKSDEPLILMVPNVIPDNTPDGYHELEKNLGSEAVGLLQKVYTLIPPDELALAFIGVCGCINAVPTLKEQVAIINELTQGERDHLLFNLSASLTAFSANPSVTRSYVYFFTDKHLRFLENTYDELFRVFNRRKDGIANYSRCTHFHHEEFPTMVKAAPELIKTRVINIFDRVSKLLPENSIFFNEPDKQSAGGWRIWATNQPGVYTAVMFALATNTMIGSKVIEAMQVAFNEVGIRARGSYNPKIEKPAIEVAFSCEKLESLSLLELELKLGSILSKYQTSLASQLAK